MHTYTQHMHTLTLEPPGRKILIYEFWAGPKESAFSGSSAPLLETGMLQTSPWEHSPLPLPAQETQQTIQRWERRAESPGTFGTESRTHRWPPGAYHVEGHGKSIRASASPTLAHRTPRGRHLWLRQFSGCLMHFRLLNTPQCEQRGYRSSVILVTTRWTTPCLTPNCSSCFSLGIVISKVFLLIHRGKIFLTPLPGDEEGG